MKHCHSLLILGMYFILILLAFHHDNQGLFLTYGQAILKSSARLAQLADTLE